MTADSRVSVSGPPTSMMQQLKVVVLLTLYIIVSGVLIFCNKFLMAKERFPHPAALTMCHMAASLLLCSLLYLCKPSLFPGMAATEGRRSQVMPWFLPLGTMFAVSLYTSNQAYFYCNVAFLQFMKEGNVVLSFLLSCAVGLQVMGRVKLATIAWILGGSLLCVSQDLHFVLIGAMIQFISQIAECSRAVMGEYILNGASIKLDPLTYTLFGAPFCLMALAVVNFLTWDAKVVVDFVAWWPYIIPNTCCAFLLNVLVATVIKECSAVGFMLAGVMKDIALVTFSALLFGEVVTRTQALSFTLVILGILFWSLLKISPDHPLVRTVERLMCVPQEDDQEAMAKKFDSLRSSMKANQESQNSLDSREKV